MHRSTLARTRPLIAALLFCVAAQALALDAKEKRIVRAVDARQAQAIGLLAETVNIQSATENHAGVRKVGDVFARELAALGFETRWVDLPPRGRARRSPRGGAPRHKGKRLLLIGHLDTVLQGEAFRRRGRSRVRHRHRGHEGRRRHRRRGAARAARRPARSRVRQVIVVFTGDEEDTGAPFESRKALFEAAAEQSDVALAFEGAAPGSP